MKKPVLILSILFLLIQTSKAQTPTWVWAEHSGGGYYEYSSGLFVDSADNLFLSGRYAGSMSFGNGPVISGGNDNPFVTQLDSSGNSIWIQHINYGYYDYERGFWRDRKNNTYTSGIVSSGASMFINKYNANGTLRWSITPSGGQIDGQAICVDKAYNIYIAGAFVGSVQFGNTPALNSSASSSLFLAKLDSNGNFIWAVGGDPAGSGSDYVYPRAITIDNSANVYITGGYQGNPVFGSVTVPAANNPSLFIVEYDSSGNALNATTATNAGINIGDCCTLKGITIDSCDNLYVTGQYQNGDAQFGSFTLSNSGGGQDVYVAKCNNAGVWQWAQGITASNGNNANAIALDKYSDVYVGGNYSTGAFVTKFDNSTGDQLWLSNISGGAGIGGITIDNQGYTFITGSFSGGVTFGSTSFNAASPGDIFLAKLDTVPPLAIVPIIDSSYCQGSTAVIPFTVLGTFNGGNVFTAELSDSTGSFINDSILGTFTSTTGGDINIKIPSNIPTGSHYLIRVVSSNPATSSYVNGCGGYYKQNVYINDFYVKIGTGSINATLIPVNPTICYGETITLKATGGGTYNWSTGASIDSIVVNPTTTATYTVIISKGSCASDTSSDVVTVLPQGAVTIQPQNPVVCDGQSITLTVNASGSNYTWSPATGLSATTGDTVVVNTTVDATYSVMGMDSLGCLVNGSDAIGIAFGPNKPTLTLSVTGDTLFSSAANGNQWFLDGQIVHGATDSIYIVKGLPAGDTITVEVTNVANGCSTLSGLFITTGINPLTINSNQLSIYPNPTNGAITVNISLSAGDLKDWNLQLTDVLGRTLYIRSSLGYTNEINLSNLASGVYFITVVNKTGRVVLPVVKQN